MMKLKFLTAIWGARYVEEFARVSLPSYLAPGNLPSLAAEIDLEIVIMTSTSSRSTFDALPIFQKLTSLCPVRFIFIDDLITTGNYGVTLTLAYARGILDSGPDQTSTNFLFMNSDFVLADGSLQTVIAKLRAGERCILAPSLRACAETALPPLIDAVNSVDHTLVVPPQQLVQLAFDHLHPTVVGKTITQGFVTCATHNQIYWQVDETTLLARYHLIFMLAIRPEVPLGPVNSYCDYGFVPTLVPSGQFTVIDDTDAFFMLELQPTAQEKQFLRCGKQTPAAIAAELSRWTTREHRRVAGTDIVFRSGRRPPSLENARIEASRFMVELRGYMRKAPLDHQDHFYWVSGLQAWCSLKFPDEVPNFPPEVAPPPIGATGWSHKPKMAKRSLLSRAYVEFLGVMRRQIGVIPNVPVWHHLWLDSRLILKWIDATKSSSKKRRLMICDEISPLPASLQKYLQFDTRIGFRDLCDASAERSEHEIEWSDSKRNRISSDRYDHLFVHISRADARALRQILKSTESYVETNGTISIFVEHRNSELDASNFSAELAQYVDEFLPADWIAYRMDASFAGGRPKRWLRLSERYLFRYLVPTSKSRLPLLFICAAIWPFVAALTALNNLRQMNSSSKCPAYCSSAMLSLTKISARTPAQASPGSPIAVHPLEVPAPAEGRATSAAHL
jgi:hypothetical protein